MSGLERRQHGGFTLVEVMISIGIMTVGSLGILSMHSAVSGANKSAQEMNTALAITERWIERIERDTLSWSQQGLNTSELTGTDYLSPLATTVDKTDWLKPLPVDTEESYGFDYFGGDTRDAGQIKYCTNLRLYWLRQGSSARVDVRTFWYREGHMDLGSAPNVNVIFASTVVTWLRRD
ncbi:MAG: prepilin-type N-terminal cleavage/methylation domain-containing protein [Deltaproteobacteria bacterium]|nr:prepilin-type N-terminal cleavage/methylation domain-containing protein [Deltaproteobacteria bacterium]